MMNSDELRDDMQRLGSRIQACRDIVDQKLSSWDSTQRQTFFDEFSNSSVMANLNQVGPDPVVRLQLFLTMPDSDLEKIMTLQACVIKDAQEGGKLGTGISQLTSSDGQSNQTSGGILGGLMSSFGALTGLGGGSSSTATGGGHDHSHSHSHSHNHHDDCEDPRSRMGVPVTKGVETMER